MTIQFYYLSGKKTKQKVKGEFKSVWLPGKGTELAKRTPYVYMMIIWRRDWAGSENSLCIYMKYDDNLLRISNIF